MDTAVYVNSTFVGEWKYGYSTFEFDITPSLREGVNEVSVRIDYRYLNSRWYSGAGIFRNVWWISRGSSFITPDGIYITPVEDANVLEEIRGKGSITFIFMLGRCFDFGWFRFEKTEKEK